MRLAHIVNPVAVGADSDLSVAQPITFETMRRAAAATELDVGLYTAQYEEDLEAVPADFQATPCLERSLRDLAPDLRIRKLPLVADILHRLLDVSDADFFIYTNVDIGVQPDFYDRIAERLAEGIDCLALRRRNLPARLGTAAAIEELYRAPGTVQRGPDCFVFPRRLLGRFRLGNVAIGEPGIGRVLLCNLYRFGRHVAPGLGAGELTFHIGNDGAWRARVDDGGRLNLGLSLRVVESLYADAIESRRALIEPHLEAVLRMWTKFGRPEQPHWKAREAEVAD